MTVYLGVLLARRNLRCSAEYVGKTVIKAHMGTALQCTALYKVLFIGVLAAAAYKTMHHHLLGRRDRLLRPCVAIAPLGSLPHHARRRCCPCKTTASGSRRVLLHRELRAALMHALVWCGIPTGSARVIRAARCHCSSSHHFRCHQINLVCGLTAYGPSEVRAPDTYSMTSTWQSRHLFQF